MRWRASLPPYQQAGIARLLDTPGVLLADEMGVGKAVQAIAALRVLFDRGAMEPALVAVPARLVPQWRKQLRDWAPELAVATCAGTPEERAACWQAPAQVYLTGFDTLPGDLALPPPHGPRLRGWGVVVADEAPWVSSEFGEAGEALRALPRRRAWALTAASVEDDSELAFSVLDFVAPGLCRRGEMVAGLRRALAVVQLRRRRADALRELAPQTVLEVSPALLPTQRAAHDRLLEQGLAWLRAMREAVQATHVLDLVLRLKQICNACPRTGASGKLEDLRRRLGHLAALGEKSLVLTQFAEAPSGAEAIAAALAPWRPLVLTGRMPPPARDAAARAFATDPARRVLVASVRAASLPPGAHAVFHFDRWRALAPAGQPDSPEMGTPRRPARQPSRPPARPLQVFAYVTPDSIEQRIGDALGGKGALFADAADGVAISTLRRLGLPALLDAVGA